MDEPFIFRGVMDYFRHKIEDSVNVIEMTLPGSIDAVDFDKINENLLRLLDATEGNRWIIDLSSVDYLGSAMLGLMVNMRQQVKQKGGKLALCCLSDRLQQIFAACCMERLFTLCKSRPEGHKAVK